MNTYTRRTLAASFALTAAAGLAACGSDDSGDAAAAGSGSASAPTSAPMTSAAMDPAAGLVGPGCAAYASAVPEGAGSVAGMAQDPVATAAGNNPLLTTLVSAVSGKLNAQVNLVDTLNSGEFTVFAPVDAAFAKVPAATIDTLKADAALLQKVLTYHVVPGRLSPDQVTGTQTTVQGGSVDVSGSGDALKVDGANVVCGGVQTANATVYLIDSVLMPG